MYRPRLVPRLFIAGALATVASSMAVAETYTIDQTHSSVEFRIRHLVGRTTGQFGDFAGTIQYDPAKPAEAKVEATIQVASIDTDNEQRDAHLKKPDFLDAARFPTIAFKSTKAEKLEAGLLVHGELTLHGVTRAIALPVEVLGLGTHPMPRMKNAPVAGFAARTTVKRSDFGVNTWTDAAGVLGDEVEVTLNIEAIGPVPAE
ncbi:MAG: YceI family protein [Candidatus Latescibacterota bacterium]|jgi:polyisoprenoid-binding protein YceI